MIPVEETVQVMETEVIEKAKRRTFPAEFKKHILDEVDRALALGEAGAVGALLRREGLYSSHLTEWRRARDAGELSGLTPKRRGPAPKKLHPAEREVGDLKRALAKAEARAKRAEALVDIQKKGEGHVEEEDREEDRGEKGPRVEDQGEHRAPRSEEALEGEGAAAHGGNTSDQGRVHHTGRAATAPARGRDGEVRCECTIEEGGIRYAGKVYRSLSAAAMAAAKDLGLVNKTQNGWNFWGLSKPPRRTSDPLVALDHAWERYHGNVEALVEEGITDENRSKVVAAIRKHAQVIESLREKVA